MCRRSLRESCGEDARVALPGMIDRRTAVDDRLGCWLVVRVRGWGRGRLLSGACCVEARHPVILPLSCLWALSTEGGMGSAMEVADRMRKVEDANSVRALLADHLLQPPRAIHLLMGEALYKRRLSGSALRSAPAIVVVVQGGKTQTAVQSPGG